MTRQELIKKFEYHIALAAEAARHGNWADMDLEDARAELAFWHLNRMETAS